MNNGNAKFEQFIARLYLARLASELSNADWERGMERAASNNALLRTLSGHTTGLKDPTRHPSVSKPITTDSPELVFKEPTKL